MKRIFTLMIALGAIAGGYTQSNSRQYPDGRYESRDVILGNRNNRSYENNGRYAYSFSTRERDWQLDHINRDYDKRIRQVEKDRWMRSYEKSTQIRRLEDQRRTEIRQVWERFRGANNAYSDNRYQRNDRRW